MKTILVLSTDKFHNGIGGLSTQLRETTRAFHQLNLPFRFVFITPGDTPEEKDNYVLLPLIDMECH